MPSPIVENRNKDYDVSDQQQQQQKSANNGFIRNQNRNGENGGDVESMGVLLEDRTINNGPSPRPMIVNFGPGATTRTSIPRQYTFGSVYKEPQLRNRLLILAVAFMVVGAAIGALTIYFAGNQTCLQGKKINLVYKF